jgi:hypothetical protein
VLIDHESTYQAELAKMSAELREAKRTARLEGAALEEDWGSQFAPDRVAQFTIAPSKTGLSAGFFEPDKALSLAVQHAFKNRSVVEEAEMITEILKWGIGTLLGKDDPKFSNWFRSHLQVALRFANADRLAAGDAINPERLLSTLERFLQTPSWSEATVYVRTEGQMLLDADLSLPFTLLRKRHPDGNFADLLFVTHERFLAVAGSEGAHAAFEELSRPSRSCGSGIRIMQKS